MSQFNQPTQAAYFDPTSSQQPASRSGLAVTALVLSLIGVIPCLGLLTAPLGVLLGLIGVVTIKPPKSGKGMAIAAVLIGVLLTGAQAYVAKRGYEFIAGFYTFVMEGPNDVLAKGMSGDIAGFKAGFHGAGASASDAEAKAFLDQLTARYGSFISARFDESGGAPPNAAGQPKMLAPYRMTFDSSTVTGEAELIFADQSTGEMVKKLGYIRIIDSANGDLVFPAGSAAVSDPAAPDSGDAGPPNGEEPAAQPDAPND